MKRVSMYLGLISLLILGSCQADQQEPHQEIAQQRSSPPSESDQTEQLERKLIKIGNVRFEVEDINAARTQIFEAVDKYKGYISSDQEYKSPNRTSNTIIIRVPSKDFDNLLHEATEGVGGFDSKEINLRDVTEEFLDIEARLKTKKELEARFLDLLKQAKTVVEILEIEKQVGTLRSEIESVEGRLKYLASQVSLSTLTMTFYESNPTEAGFGKEFKNGFGKGWDNLVWFFVFLVNIWPFILIGLGLLFGLRWYGKRRKKA